MNFSAYEMLGFVNRTLNIEKKKRRNTAA